MIATEAGDRLWYRLHDSDPIANRGAHLVTRADAATWNAKGWGVFWTVNRFVERRRVIANLDGIAAWAIDIDDGTKEEMRAKLAASPLVPSLIVETKRGYQAYWGAKDGKPEHWNAIVLDRLVAHYGADKNARDLARILRVPGYLHLKNPAEPFRIAIVHEHRVKYTERQIVEHYADRGEHKSAVETHAEVKRTVKFADSDGFWDRVWNLNCATALDRLSGHPAVRGERYTFHDNRSGTRNIFADGKPTSAWVDKDGRIGSLSKGGPTVAQWLRWFGASWGDVAKVLKSVFPELEPKK